MSELTPEGAAEIKAAGEPVYLTCPPVDGERQRRLGILDLKNPASWTQDRCGFCGCAVWVGPKLRAAKQEFTLARFACFECASRQTGGQVDRVVHLGGESSDYTIIERGTKGTPGT